MAHAIADQPYGVYEHWLSLTYQQCSGSGGRGSCEYLTDTSETITVSVIDPTPTGLTGPAIDYNGSFTVGWNASPGAPDYQLQRRIGSGSWSQIYSGSSTSKAESSLAAGTYTYRVRACMPECSAWSSSHSTVVEAPPSIPSGLTGPATDYNGSFTVSWNASGNSTSYRLQRMLGSGSWAEVYSGSATSKAESSLAPGSYSYRVRGCNIESVCSSWSAVMSVTVVGAPPAPTGLTGPGTDTDGNYSISWNAASGASSYRLQEQFNGGSWSQVYSGAATSDTQSGQGNGNYAYRVRSCNLEALCGSWSATHTVTVSLPPPPPDPPATPPPPAPNVDPGQASSEITDSIGTTAGNFRVDESGAATYSIPIATAAGTAGVAPQISLSYSSNAGNGVAGHGWSIGGLSAISRCRQTLDQDNNVNALDWSSNDRFCLDGQRLLLTGGATYGDMGSTYRTEIDSGAIVTAVGGTNGGPDYFSVRRKDGSTTYYGKSPVNADESAKLQNDSGQTLTWSIRHFEDSVGNPIWFEYDTSNGAQRIDQIAYAYGSSQGPSGYGARVKFVYQARPDRISGYVAGTLFENDQRLSRIRSYNTISSEALIREYVLRYDEGIVIAHDATSRLTSVQECVDTTCLPKTTFDWRVPANSSLIQQLAQHSLSSDLAAFVPADINGDGRMDLAWLSGSGVVKSLSYAIATGSGFANQPFSNGNFGLNVGSSTTSAYIRAIDYNLDGRQDITWWDENAGAWKLVISEPYGDSQWRLRSSMITTPVPSAGVTFADVDANGTTDAIYKIAGATDNSMYLRRLEHLDVPVSSSTYYEFGAEIRIAGSGTDNTIGTITALAGDFNGDGQVDVAMGGKEERCDEDFRNCNTVRNFRALAFHNFNETPSISSYHHFSGVWIESLQQLHFPVMGDLQAVDINADGLSDAFYPVAPFFGTDTSQYGLEINKGNGDFEFMHVTDASLTRSDANPQLVDWNMDGYQDLIWKDSTGSGSIKVRYWRPASGDLDVARTITTAVSNSALETVHYFDINGDGAPDIVRMNAAGTVGNLIAMTRKAGAAVANVGVNRIDRITNGLGAVTDVVYAPLSYTDHYERLEVASSPGTQTICQDMEQRHEGMCWQEPVQVADADTFYSTINGNWDLPSGAQTLGKTSPIIEMSGPMYVVTDVIGDAPAAGSTPGNVDTNATSSISYYYGEAKMQAAGRGFLGFQRLKTIDNQSNVETITRYRQDWPFIGNPIFTEVLSAAGHPLSRTTTAWEVLEWQNNFPATANDDGTAALGPLHVVQSRGSEQTFDLVGNGAGAGSLISAVSTASNYDSEANAWQVVVTTRDGGGTAVKIVDTLNAYLDNGTFDLFDGRLSQTTVTTTHNGTVVSPGRISTFDYHTGGAQKGLLWHETIEPGTGFELVTTHEYDAFGNRVFSSTSDGTVTRCAVDTVAYDSSGRYVDSTFDCLGRKLSDVVARNPFGSPTNIRTFIVTNGTDHTTTLISYSTLGREYYRYNSDGSHATKYMTLSVSDCPGGTAFMTSSADASGAEARECIDLLGRPVRTMTKGFDGQWDAQDTEYDEFGNVRRKSEPFDLISGGQVAPRWTTFVYDILGRVTSTTLPDNSSGSTSYSGLTTTTTNNLGQTRTEVRNVLGEVVSVTDNLGGVTQFDYDHHGNMRTMVDSAGNVTTIHYDLLGRKEWTDDPDKGLWTYEYNRFGELILQTDAKGQTQTMTYDGLGRLKTRIDRTASGAIEGSTTWTFDTAAYGLGQLDNVSDSQSGYMKAVLYDSLGRPSETITNFDGGIYFEKTTFDQFGRLFQVFDAAGNGSFTDKGIVNSYNASGYLESVSDAVSVSGVTRTVYRKIIDMNARGQVTLEQRGIDNLAPVTETSVTTIYDYSAATGRLLKIDGINAAGLDVQDLSYAWDTLGNLISRHEMSGSKNLNEAFFYDGLNRLTSQSVSGQSSVTLSYDAIGNIESKSDVGSYTYGAGTAGPHAVTSAGGATYLYDANGNNTSGGGRSISYTVFDKPKQISKGGHTTSFAYGPDRSRYRRIDSGSGGTTTTRYLGNVEIIFTPDGDQIRKRYIAGVAIETTRYGGDSIEDSRETHYQHLDHLGSLDVITDSTGAVVQEMSFDAWGQRRNAIDWSALSSGELAGFDHSLTTRGFTGHEMLDEVGLIHMNGRIYDPELARFLQADPIIQDPLNTQSLNRYSYVWNNPLNATDPSGYFVFSLIIAAAFIGEAWSTAWAVAFALAGFVDATIAGADLNDALLAGISAAAFAGFGSFLAEAGGLWSDWHTQVLAMSTLGGVTSVIQGGKFGHGFRSTGLGMIAGGVAGRVSQNLQLKKLGQSVARIVAAGTASALSGGKFANGALSTAFVSAMQTLEDRSLRIGGGDRGVQGTSLSDAGNSFEERAIAYRKMQVTLDAAGVDSVWFGVASDLNQLFADRSFLLGPAYSYLNELGGFLYAENLATFEALISGDLRLTGQALDNHLVLKEQLLVQKFTASRFESGSIPGYVAAPVNVAFTAGIDFMPKNIQLGVQYVERMYSTNFDYWDTAHRVTLGESMMSIARHLPDS